MKILISSLILLLSLVLYSFADDNKTGTISGFVFDKSDGEVLIGVNVYLEEKPLGSSTNLSGYYVMPEVPSGSYTLICSHIGYKIIRKKITMKPNDNIRLNISLNEDLIQTETIVVTADSIPLAERLFNKSISEIKISPVDIQRIPQVAEADLLRSLQTLPGVLPLYDYSSALYIRGGTPDQNLYLLDGTDVYNPEHAFGVFSTFNTEAIKQVELYKGGFGAEYGGRLSSILNITNLDGNREEFEGSISISLLSAKTTVQMPIGKSGSISGSIRRTYFDQTVGKSIDEIPDYYFYDGNLKAFFELDANNKISISTYGGRDVLSYTFNEKASDPIGIKYDWGNRNVSMRWTRVFNPKLFANFWITNSRFSSDFKFNELNMVERNFVSDLTFKGNMEYQPFSTYGLKFGFEQKNLHVLYREIWDDGKVDVNMYPEHYAGYLQNFWTPSPKWEFEFGIRYNLFYSDTTYWDFAPRLATKYRLSEKTNLKLAAGIYHQYLHRIPRFFVTDIWSASNQYQQDSKSWHLVAGYQKEIGKEYHFEIEGFYKGYENLHTFNHNFTTELMVVSRTESGDPIYSETKGIFHEGDGHSTGIELLVRKESGVVTGWLGYSYAKTKYRFERLNQNRFFAPRHDRSSTLNIVANIDLKNSYRSLRNRPVKKERDRLYMGVNFVYSTGQPFTEPGSAYIIGSSPVAPQRHVEYAPTKINNIRFPYYARLDLSVTYEKWFENWYIAPYVQIYNIGNRRNVWFPSYEYENGIPDIKENYMFPLLPTLGINIKF